MNIHALARAALAVALPLVLAAAPIPATAQTESPAPAASQPRDAVRISYPGGGVEIRRGSGDERRLKGTPRSLKRFVRARLDKLYRQAGSRPRCATAPTVIISRYHSSGFATVGEGWYGPCPEGGYSITYVRQDGKWRAVLGTHEALYCTDLQWFGIPPFIAGRSCLDELDFTILPYRLGAQPRSSAAASTRRLINITGTPRSIPVPAFATSTAARKMRALLKRAWFEIEECTVGGEPTSAGPHLAPGQEGCSILGHHNSGLQTVHLVPMEVDADGTYIAQDVFAIPAG